MLNPDYYKDLPAKLKKEALNKLVTSQITIDQFRTEMASIEFMQMSTEEICRKVVSFEGRPGLTEFEQKTINKCKDHLKWINENY